MKKQCFTSPGISKAGRQTGQTRLRSVGPEEGEQRCVQQREHPVQRGSAAQNGTKELACDERCIDQKKGSMTNT